MGIVGTSSGIMNLISLVNSDCTPGKGALPSRLVSAWKARDRSEVKPRGQARRGANSDI